MYLPYLHLCSPDSMPTKVGLRILHTLYWPFILYTLCTLVYTKTGHDVTTFPTIVLFSPLGALTRLFYDYFVIPNLILTSE
jgi:hypothetical protein